MTGINLRTYTYEELDEIFAKHLKWLRNENGGKQAVFRRTDFSNVDLSYYNLQQVEFYYCDFTNVNLTGAPMSSNVFVSNNFDDNIWKKYYPIACPDTGTFIGWKRCGDKIVKIEVPAEAKRTSSFGRICRCSKVKVLAIENLDGTPAEETSVSSNYDSNFIYTVGETITINNFNENRLNPMENLGIFFFITRAEAENYEVN